jgi:hypothetical protein
MNAQSAVYNDIATAIVRGQQQVMGKVAVTMAAKVLGHGVPEDGTIEVGTMGADAINGLVQEYSSITGPLGVRMCHTAARPVLDAHPGVEIPVFAHLG